MAYAIDRFRIAKNTLSDTDGVRGILGFDLVSSKTVKVCFIQIL